MSRSRRGGWQGSSCALQSHTGASVQRKKSVLLSLTVFKFFISYNNFCIDFDGQKCYIQGMLIRESYLRGPQLNTKTWLYPTACWFHGWKSQAEQIVRQEHNPTHQKKKKYYIQICLAWVLSLGAALRLWPHVNWVKPVVQSNAWSLISTPNSPVMKSWTRVMSVEVKRKQEI